VQHRLSAHHDFAVRYHQLAAPLATISFAETRQHGIWTIEPLLHPQMDAELYRFAVELQFGTHVSLHRDVMGPAFAPHEVCVTYRPRDAEPLPMLIGCPVRFEQPANQLIFDADWLDAVPTLGNRITFSAVIEACDDLLKEMERRTASLDGFAKSFFQLLPIGRPWTRSRGSWERPPARFGDSCATRTYPFAS
jgi:hypothetical protein